MVKFDVHRTVWSAALILLLGLFAFEAGKAGLSNFYAQSAHLEIERWTKPGQAYRPDDWTRAVEYLDMSLHYSPDNAWSLEERGALRLRSIGTFTDAQLAVAAARSANADFHLALAERPTSPFAWANFALTKLNLDERDGELIHALRRAEELGPWEPEVQQTVVFTGLAVWNRLNPAEQAVVLRAMERGAQRNQGNIFEIAKSFNRIDLFCTLGYSGLQGRDICRPPGKIGKNPKGVNDAMKGNKP